MAIARVKDIVIRSFRFWRNEFAKRAVDLDNKRERERRETGTRQRRLRQSPTDSFTRDKTSVNMFRPRVFLAFLLLLALSSVNGRVLTVSEGVRRLLESMSEQGFASHLAPQHDLMNRITVPSSRFHHRKPRSWPTETSAPNKFNTP
jgi:hypothetical protein